MKGTFSSYDPKTGKGTITQNPEPAAQGLSFGAAAGVVLAAKDYPFSIPSGEALHAKIKKGDKVEFELSKNKNGDVKILRY